MTDHTQNRPRLATATLAQLPASVRRYRYNRDRLTPGIVHLGLGAFARAHICDYTDEALDVDFGAWGITGINLRSTDMLQKLAPQNFLYSSLSRDVTGTRARLIGSVMNVEAGPASATRVVEILSQPETRIVSLTITEKGYCHDPASGQLNVQHPDIQYDLASPEATRSAIGILCRALALRRQGGLKPFTVLCCDNLPHNGALVAGLLRSFAALRDDGLARWIEVNVPCPSTMVDRIVPAVTPQDIMDTEALLGLYDAAPVAHEPFRQWVIEDRFVDDARPAWDKVGAELVSDVAPYEHMKLRVLNAAHSALAYAGYLGGHETIGDCVADPLYRDYVRSLWTHEILPMVATPPGANLAQYADALLLRFANPAIRHRTWQIAMDGSQKLPQRILATIRDRIRCGLPYPGLALAVAAWVRYARGVDESGRLIDVRDPMAGSFKEVFALAGDAPQAQVSAALKLGSIFGTDLSNDDSFAEAVGLAYGRICEAGIRSAISATLA